MSGPGWAWPGSDVSAAVRMVEMVAVSFMAVVLRGEYKVLGAGLLGTRLLSGVD